MATDLIFEESILEVHADLDPWAALSVGFNDDKMLVFELTFDRAEEYRGAPAGRWDKRVFVDRKGIDVLLDRMGTRLMDLPKAISKKFGYEDESWRASEVLETFEAILAYLERLNIRYRMEKE